MGVETSEGEVAGATAAVKDELAVRDGGIAREGGGK